MSRPPDDGDAPGAGPRRGADPLAPFDGEADDWLEVAREAERPRGAVLGAYEIVEEVRTGGQGLVLRARQPNTGRDVALKRLAAGALSSTRERHRFEREVDLVGQLDHPGIVTMYGVEVIDGVPLLAMEWVDGLDLATWSAALGDGTPVERRLRTFLTLCDAVAHAHGRGVIHRDLKPENVLVDAEDRCRVLDFGLARSVSAGGPDDASRTIGFVGTPAYAPPESFTLGAAPIDARGDVYSLGVLLYEMLTGRLPFERDSIHGVAFDKENAAPRPPSRRGGRISRELDTIVTTAMAREPEARYPTVDALAEDVRRHLDGRPVLAVPPSALYVLGKWVRRNRAVAALLVALALLLVSGLAVTATMARTVAAERDRADDARRAAEAAAVDARREKREAERARDGLEAALAEAREHERRTRNVQDAYLDAVFLRGDSIPTDRSRPLAEVVESLRRLAAERLEDAPDLRTEILSRVATYHVVSGDLDAAERIATEALETERRRGGGAAGTTAQLLGTLANVRSARSDPAGALDAAVEAGAFLDRLADPDAFPRTRCLTTTMVGLLRARAGDPDAALPALVAAARIAEEARLPLPFALPVEAARARLHLDAGRTGAARALARSALERAATAELDDSLVPTVSALHRTLGDARFSDGDLACGAEAHRLRVDFERARGAAPTDALRDDTFRAGFLLLRRGAAAEALRVFELLLAMNPDLETEFAARRGLAEGFVLLGDPRRAAPHYDALLRRTRRTLPAGDPGRVDLVVRAAMNRAAMEDPAGAADLLAVGLHDAERGVAAGTPPDRNSVVRLAKLADLLGLGEEGRATLADLGLTPP